jgi:hypothetical protein
MIDVLENAWLGVLLASACWPIPHFKQIRRGISSILIESRPIHNEAIDLRRFSSNLESAIKNAGTGATPENA